MPFGIPDYHKSLEKLHVGTEKPHAYFIPYHTEEASRLPREHSKFFKSLSGEWDFKFSKSKPSPVGEGGSRRLTDEVFPT